LERRFGPGALAGRGRCRRTAAAGPAVVARARRSRVLRAAAAGGRRRGRPRTAGGGPAFGEAGRALLPGPLIATHLAAGTVPGAATGETVVAAVDGASWSGGRRRTWCSATRPGPSRCARWTRWRRCTGSGAGGRPPPVP